MLTTKPESPKLGDQYVDIKSRTVNVFDGSDWVVFTEYEMAEMEVTQVLMSQGYTEEAAAALISVLQHGHSH